MDYSIGQALGYLFKSAGKAELSYGLTGKLHFSKSGWLLLTVPNALGVGAFDALGEPGVELPGDPYNAHITVMSPSEVEAIGPDKISERGHEFTYTLGPVRSVDGPAGQKELSRVWYIEVRSPDLEKLRKSYGLSATPKDGEYDFHITFACRKKKVLQDNPVAKAASLVHDLDTWCAGRPRRRPLTPSFLFADC